MVAQNIETRSVLSKDGVKLEYSVVGSGEPVLFLHGLFTGRAAFSKQHELAEQWRLVLPSTRAHDGTEGRLPPDYSFHTELNDLLTVLHAEQLERFHVVGHSSGGTLAFALARSHPHRVRKMVLIEPTLFEVLNEPERREISSTFLSFAETGRRSGDRAGLDAALNWLGGEGWRSLDDHKRASRLDAMQPVQHLIVPHMHALVDFSAPAEDVKALHMPTLLIYGANSYPVEAQLAQRFRELRPDWPQIVIEGAGHNCYREKPTQVNAALRTFLG
jgi:pimeloyl-ACP methyl ester carboxylesterase